LGAMWRRGQKISEVYPHFLKIPRSCTARLLIASPSTNPATIWWMDGLGMHHILPTPCQPGRQELPEPPCDRIRREGIEALELFPDNRFPERAVAAYGIRQLRDCRVVFLPHEHAGVAERLGNRPRCIRDDGETEVHRLQQRHTEAFVLAHAEENVRAVVEGVELGAHDVVDKNHIGEIEQPDQGIQVVCVAVHAHE